MTNKIYGRKVGSRTDMVLLIEGDGVSTGGVKVHQGELEQFAVANARRAVQGLRGRGVEAYLVFEGDPTRYDGHKATLGYCGYSSGPWMEL